MHWQMNGRFGSRSWAADRFVLYAREGAPEMFDAIVAICKKAKFFPRILASLNLWQTVLTIVEAGEGVAIVQQLRSDAVSFHPLLDRTATWMWSWPGAVMNRMPFVMAFSISRAII
jgi:hypothetical protein